MILADIGCALLFTHLSAHLVLRVTIYFMPIHYVAKTGFIKACLC